MMSQTQPLPQKPLQRLWLWPVLPALALILAFLLPVPHNGTIAGLPKLCAFYLTTGLPCPGCGLTRSVVSCAHGNWSAAVYYHPLGPLVFAAFIALTAAGTLQLVYPRRM